MPPFRPLKDVDDDETVDSVDDPPPTSGIQRRKNRLTVVSRKYDLDGDGVLDEAEQAMRDRDVSGRGYLTNEEIYDIVKGELRAKRRAGRFRMLVASLVCFVVLLALSNLGTSWASAVLARDLAADEKGDVPVMRSAATGGIAATQSAADTYEALEMTDEEVDQRRRLVLDEMEVDPHSHAHRRDLRKCSNIMGADCEGKVTFDTGYIEDKVFVEIEDKCKRQENVYMKQTFGDDRKNECVCGRGTSVVVKGKKGKGRGKGKDKGKKDKGKGKRGPREVIIERVDGLSMHADCDGKGRCYLGGTTLQGGRGDPCRPGFDDCGLHNDKRHLVCEREKNKKKGKGGRARCVLPDKTSVIFVERGRPARPNEVCLVNAIGGCKAWHWCEPDDFLELRADFLSATGVCVRARAGIGQTCYLDGQCRTGYCVDGLCAVSRPKVPGGGGGGRGGWYPDYGAQRCINNGVAKKWDETYATPRDCCKEKLWWIAGCSASSSMYN